jgi:hypothetical protein
MTSAGCPGQVAALLTIHDLWPSRPMQRRRAERVNPMPSATQIRLHRLAEAVALRSKDAQRHKCFVSYHADDEDEVAAFLEKFGDVFIPRVIGVSEEDDFIDSSDTDYVMDRLREKYLTDSTVTICLVGVCTWARRFVDWEIYSTLRNDKNNRRSGLLAITLPSASQSSLKQLPPRLADNHKGTDGTEGYARWWKYPTTAESVRTRIQIAFDDRTGKADLIDNTRTRKLRNSSCP